MCWIFFEEKNVCIFYHFSIAKWHRLLKYFLMGDNDLSVLHNQCHGCWWPGDARGQSFSSHCIDLVLIGYFSFSIRNFCRHFHIELICRYCPSNKNNPIFNLSRIELIEIHLCSMCYKACSWQHEVGFQYLWESINYCKCLTQNYIESKQNIWFPSTN